MLFLFVFIYFYLVYECVPACVVCAPRAWSAGGGQNTVSDPQELELQMIVSHHMGARNQTRSFARAVSALDL